MNHIALLTGGADAPSAADIEFQAGPKCGQCVHWHRLPPPKRQTAEDRRRMEAAMEQQNLPAEQRAKVREQVRLQEQGTAIDGPGECREHLRLVAILAQGPNGQPVLVAKWGEYISPVPPDFRACGRFEAREAVPPG